MLTRARKKIVKRDRRTMFQCAYPYPQTGATVRCSGYLINSLT